MKNLIIIIALVSFNAFSQDSWSFTPDKQKHFFFGGVPSMVTSATISNLNPDQPKYLKGFLVGSSVGVGLNLAKEGFDLLGFGHPSYHDLAYGALGSVIGSAVGVSLAYTVNKLENRIKKRKLKL